MMIDKTSDFNIISIMIPTGQEYFFRFYLQVFCNEKIRDVKKCYGIKFLIILNILSQSMYTWT